VDWLPLQRSLVHERVAAERAFLTLLSSCEDDFDVHDWQLTNPRGRQGVDHLAG